MTNSMTVTKPDQRNPSLTFSGSRILGNLPVRGVLGSPDYRLLLVDAVCNVSISRCNVENTDPSFWTLVAVSGNMVL